MAITIQSVLLQGTHSPPFRFDQKEQGFPRGRQPGGMAEQKLTANETGTSPSLVVSAQHLNARKNSWAKKLKLKKPSFLHICFFFQTVGSLLIEAKGPYYKWKRLTPLT